jgi:hypothetical protein
MASLLAPISIQAPEVLDYIKQVPSDIGRVEAGEF